eukprot:1162049-Pelagomonas_calceolata.AAC.3
MAEGEPRSCREPIRKEVKGSSRLLLPMSVLTKPAPPRAFSKSFDDHSSSNIAVFSFHARDDILAAREYVECAVYLMTARWEKA